MSLLFEADLEELKRKLLIMAEHAASAVSRAMQAATIRDDALARRVQEDDNILDHFEVSIDDAAINLLVRASQRSERRLIAVAMKISHDLERVGDEATTIARRAVELSREPALPTRTDLNQMAGLALRMLRDALEAFVNRDSPRARATIPGDTQIDDLNRQLQLELMNHMAEDPATVSRCLHWMTISKALERIGDHATNVAEEVVYLYEGRDIRHQPGRKNTASRSNPK